ncbi:putative WRKY transcription factor 4 [Giardia muris]|uniref:Putative WRKY transcription factor 4 n=1 Tax=Giardia muris TaxID=5742 RepID=A0A4Z1SS93_GIAMU|nr:putative WRKY transcription factor 4 [Giardia muris]|eukprot:TNJ26528.1 putative WRKY transcription factor 4 [Giardia muris]
MPVLPDSSRAPGSSYDVPGLPPGAEGALRSVDGSAHPLYPLTTNYLDIPGSCTLVPGQASLGPGYGGLKQENVHAQPIPYPMTSPTSSTLQPQTDPSVGLDSYPYLPIPEPMYHPLAHPVPTEPSNYTYPAEPVSSYSPMTYPFRQAMLPVVPPHYARSAASLPTPVSSTMSPRTRTLRDQTPSELPDHHTVPKARGSEACKPRPRTTPAVSRLTLRDLAPDGYSWRKYGSKAISTAEYPKCYFRCAIPGCGAKRYVTVDPKTHACISQYIGTHTHPKTSLIQIEATTAADYQDLVFRSQVFVVPLEVPVLINRVAHLVTYSKAFVTQDMYVTHILVDAFHSLIDNEDMTQIRRPGPRKGTPLALSDYMRPNGKSYTLEHLVHLDDDHAICTPEQLTECRATALCYKELWADQKDPGTRRTGCLDRRVSIVCKPLSGNGWDVEQDGLRWKKYGQKTTMVEGEIKSYYRCSVANCPVRRCIVTNRTQRRDSCEAYIVYENRHNHEPDKCFARHGSHESPRPRTTLPYHPPDIPNSIPYCLPYRPSDTSPNESLLPGITHFDTGATLLHPTDSSHSTPHIRRPPIPEASRIAHSSLIDLQEAPPDAYHEFYEPHDHSHEFLPILPSVIDDELELAHEVALISSSEIMIPSLCPPYDPQDEEARYPELSDPRSEEVGNALYECNVLDQSITRSLFSHPSI